MIPYDRVLTIPARRLFHSYKLLSLCPSFITMSEPEQRVQANYSQGGAKFPTGGIFYSVSCRIKRARERLLLF